MPIQPNKLLLFGLAIIPFFVWFAPGFDTRVPKENLAIMLALAISAIQITFTGIKPISNKWFTYLIPFLFLSLLMSPMGHVFIGSEDVNGFWNYKPTMYAIIYFMLLVSVASMSIERIKVFKYVSTAGVVMSVIVILQWLGFDQFFHVKPLDAIGHVPNANLTGTLGQPTVCAAFLAMCLPFALRLKNYLAAGFIFVTILLLRSDMATISSVFASTFYLFYNNKFILMALCGSILTIIALFLVLYCENSLIRNKLVNDGGRWAIWVDIMKEVKENNSITGHGLGSFKYMYSIVKKSPWAQAHNEYLQMAYSIGLIGLGLFLLAAFDVLKASRFFISNEDVRALLSSVSASFITAFGSFNWQLGAHTFYTVVFIGLIYNITKESQCETK